MMLVFLALGVLSCLELLLWTQPLWQQRKIITYVLLAALAVTSLALLIIHIATWTILLMVVSLYRCVNLARIAANRVQPDYLFHISRSTALRLLGLQLLIAAAAAYNHYYDVHALLWWNLLAGGQFLFAAILLSSTLRHLRTTLPGERQSPLPEKDLPTLTVAIPARNETVDLEDCLRTAVASNYPKLEILVLDDCSQNQRTPEIIRQFAQHGVQFIAGNEPPASWLAKNYAYHQLAQASNSELILFCGVDSRFQPDSFQAIVETMLKKKKSMLSIMPGNDVPKARLQSFFVQPGRYAWELALPRRLLERPPVLSTCWLITRQALEAAGGFTAVRRKGVPESYFARVTAAASDGYSFLQADNNMGISSHKSLPEQRATAIRTRYLQLHRRIELVALISLMEFFTLVLPLITTVIGILDKDWFLTMLSGLSYMMLSIMYSKIITITYRCFSFISLWVLPLAAVYDIGLLNYSMWQYEFSEVLWKGRNICLPIMRAIQQLPKT